MLRALLSGTTDIIYAKDLEGRYLLINEAGARILGRPTADIIGRDDRALFPPDSVEAIIKRDREVIAAGESCTVEDVMTIDGVTRVFLSTKGVFHDDTGKVVGLFGISRDISERKRREQEHDRLLRSEQAARADAERAAQALGDLLAVTEAALSRIDLDELLDCVMEKVEAVFRADTVAILLRPVDEDVLVLRAARGAIAPDELGSRVPFSGTVARQVVEHGRPFWIEDLSNVEVERPALGSANIRSLLVAPMLLSDRVAGVVHVGTVEPRRFDDNDARLLQLVADRITQAVEHARLFEASQRAIQSRDEMLAVISHDLGNPLNGIVLNANLLERRARPGRRRRAA